MLLCLLVGVGGLFEGGIEFGQQRVYRRRRCGRLLLCLLIGIGGLLEGGIKLGQQRVHRRRRCWRLLLCLLVGIGSLFEGGIKLGQRVGRQIVRLCAGFADQRLQVIIDRVIIHGSAPLVSNSLARIHSSARR